MPVIFEEEILGGIGSVELSRNNGGEILILDAGF